MASTILVNTINTQSGTTITIPTGKSLVVTDAGALTIGGVAITAGSLGTISKTTAYTILPGDFTSKSNLVVFVNAAAGTDTETIITLPAASAFSTCAINVVSTTAHGSGNSITVKNASAVEQFTLYRKGDHCEFVSDGTNIFRTGNEYTTIWARLELSADAASGAGASYIRMFDANVLVAANYGSAWSAGNYEWTAPFTGTIACDAFLPTTAGSSSGNPLLYKDTGSGFAVVTGSVSGSAGSASTGWFAATLAIDVGDKLRPYYYKNTAGSEGPRGNVGGTAAYFDFRYLRRS